MVVAVLAQVAVLVVALVWVEPPFTVAFVSDDSGRLIVGVFEAALGVGILVAVEWLVRVRCFGHGVYVEWDDEALVVRALFRTRRVARADIVGVRLRRVLETRWIDEIESFVVAERGGRETPVGPLFDGDVRALAEELQRWAAVRPA